MRTCDVLGTPSLPSEEEAEADATEEPRCDEEAERCTVERADDNSRDTLPTSAGWEKLAGLETLEESVDDDKGGEGKNCPEDKDTLDEFVSSDVPTESDEAEVPRPGEICDAAATGDETGGGELEDSWSEFEGGTGEETDEELEDEGNGREGDPRGTDGAKEEERGNVGR